MSKQLFRHKLDPANLPLLTNRQKAELAALDNREIDTSDIPEATRDFWDNAVRGRFYKPIKTSTTVRIDADVLAWLRAEGKGYQSRINAILRREMLAAAAKGESTARPKEGGLDSVDRDKNGGVHRKHGNTHVGTLRKHYGAGFASGFKDTDTLARVLDTLDESSLARLMKGHLARVLDTRDEPLLTELMKDRKAKELRSILGAAA
jgi:uncharacterized protein (DUF4415 family)